MYSLVMQETDFIEIFVNNEAQTPVYYDNMQVVMRGGSVMDIYAYYPFGTQINYFGGCMCLDDYNYYTYNGKESGPYGYDYGARLYDATVGRWFVVDPMAEWRYSTSPYAFCSNNPINRIDPNGNLDFGWLKEWLERMLEQLKNSITIPIFNDFDNQPDAVNENNPIELKEFVVVGTGTSKPAPKPSGIDWVTWPARAASQFWGYGRGGEVNYGQVGYYYNPIDGTDMLGFGLHEVAGTGLSLLKMTRNVSGMVSVPGKIKDAANQAVKGADEIARAIDARVKENTGDNNDASGRTNTGEQLVVSKDSIWVGFWDHSGVNPQHKTHKIHKQDTAKYNSGFNKTTRKSPAIERR